MLLFLLKNIVIFVYKIGVMIKNEIEYRDALIRLDQIFDAKSGTPLGLELDILADRIVRWEELIEMGIDFKLVQVAKNWAIEKHSETNHLYDGKPYQTHLEMVYKWALKFIHLLEGDSKLLSDVLCVAWTHDTIEDCRQTFNDVKSNLNLEIAEMTYALTNEKGRTRSERANDKYYSGLRDNTGAHFIKICDRLANVEYSKLSGSSMFKKYKIENVHFSEKLGGKFNDMFIELENLFN